MAGTAGQHTTSLGKHHRGVPPLTTECGIFAKEATGLHGCHGLADQANIGDTPAEQKEVIAALTGHDERRTRLHGLNVQAAKPGLPAPGTPVLVQQSRDRTGSEGLKPWPGYPGDRRRLVLLLH